MNKSESIKNISKALSDFQKEVTNPANTAKNPFYNSKYAPLSDVLNVVRPVLGKYGLSVIQNPYTDENGAVAITTMLCHESGEWIETESMHLKLEKNTPQGIGSAITYGRRYAISSILGIASEEDDDGNVNESKKPPTKGADVKPEPSAEEVTAQKELKETIDKIVDLSRGKSAISEDVKAIVKSILAQYQPKGNPNKITDLKKAKDCLKEIEGINVEETVNE